MIMNGLSQGGGSDSRVPVIYTTSYVGTRTYGKDNPNTLTFDFVPEFIWIVYKIEYQNNNPIEVKSLLDLTSSSSTTYTGVPFIITSTLSTTYEQYKGLHMRGNYNNTWVRRSEDKKSISWYNTFGSYAQYNGDMYASTYHVLAIGYKEES